MNTSKKRYDGKFKVTRVLLADYLLLKEIARGAGITMAEALHLAIERQEVVTRVSPSQIPIAAFRVPGLPTIRVAPVTVTAVNGAGAKHSTLAIKPKGGKCE